MNFIQWKREVWPMLSESKRQEILSYVRELRAEGWEMTEAWIQAACVA